MPTFTKMPARHEVVAWLEQNIAKWPSCGKHVEEIMRLLTKEWPEHRIVGSWTHTGGVTFRVDPWGPAITEDEWLKARQGYRMNSVAKAAQNMCDGLARRHADSMQQVAANLRERADEYYAEQQREKQDRYLDDDGDDWIDEFARTSTYEEFCGAMRFTIGKYNRRMGKKDDMLKEVRKMKDYCERWEEYLIHAEEEDDDE